mmetsp:Transcript_6072/g.19429  ORF Transcript_6072/g.19429 Transcript_6072/m.19429 type:complete len:203 (-) Transcript_6072:23-631(-)
MGPADYWRTFKQHNGDVHLVSFAVVYSIISLTTFLVVLTALAWGADAAPFLREFSERHAGAGHASVIILAIACTKLLIPLKLPLAGAITVCISKRRKAREALAAANAAPAESSLNPRGETSPRGDFADGPAYGADLLRAGPAGSHDRGAESKRPLRKIDATEMNALLDTETGSSEGEGRSPSMPRGRIEMQSTNPAVQATLV